MVRNTEDLKEGNNTQNGNNQIGNAVNTRQMISIPTINFLVLSAFEAIFIYTYVNQDEFESTNYSRFGIGNNS
jgi:hypothetical protein